MANIERELQAIMEAEYGEEVRSSIHDAIKAGNDEIVEYGMKEVERSQAEKGREAAEEIREEVKVSMQQAAESANAAAEAAKTYVLGDISHKTVTFSQAAEFANIQPGDSLATAFGKLSKFCEDAENGHMNYWSLSGGTPILPNTDLNTLTGVGNYYCATNAYAGTLQHTPVTTAFTMKNFHGNGTDYLTQHLQVLSDGAIWRRVLGTEGSWNAWSRIIPSIANNLITTTSGSVLDACQGKVLDDKITQLKGNILTYMDGAVIEKLTIPSSRGFVSVPVPQTGISYLFATVAGWYNNTGAFSVGGQQGGFYVIGTPGTEITNLVIRFWYLSK